MKLLKKPTNRKKRKKSCASREAWFVAHSVIATEPKAKLRADMVMVASNGFIDGMACFKKAFNSWELTLYSKQLSFLRSLPFDEIKNEMIRRGFIWSWTPLHPPLSTG